MPRPPPTFRIRHSQSLSTRRPSASIADTYGSSSNTCEPICACSPTSRRFREARTSAIARSASPSSSPKPNLESRPPVWTNECVAGRTPGVTRIRTSCGRSSIASSRSISPKESTMMWPTSASIAKRSSELVLLFPWRWMRAGTQGQVELAARRNVDRQALLRAEPVDGRDRRRLARVEDLVIVGP